MSGWISIQERFPEPLVSILFLYQDKVGEEVLTGYWDHRNRCFVQTAVAFLPPHAYEEASEYLYHTKRHIKYWMPLPEPPDHIGGADKMEKA